MCNICANWDGDTMRDIVDGLEFFVQCFEKYWEHQRALPWVYLLSLLYIAFFKKGVWKNSLFYPFLFSVITIFNPYKCTKDKKLENTKSKPNTNPR